MINSSTKISRLNEVSDFVDESLMLYTFFNYLKSRKLFNEYFSIPIEIKKRESPDFEVNNNYGIEIAFAAPQSLRYADVLFDKASNNNILELDEELVNSNSIKRNDIKKFIKGPAEDLSENGYYADQLEFIWSKKVVEQIVSKTHKLNTIYTIFDKNILLVNGDFLLPRVRNISEICLRDELRINVELSNYKIKFTEIFILLDFQYKHIIRINSDDNY